MNRIEDVCAPPRLGPYRLLAPITAGRLGILYRAVQEEGGQAVCLKLFPAVLDDGREWARRMERELHFSAALDHPNVVRTLGIEQAEGTWYLVMEDLEGETLDDRLGRDGRLPYPTACHLIGDAALGLAHLHDKFVVHRDVQPANLWITPEGRVKVMELGAVRNALTALKGPEDSTVTRQDTVIGVYDYMAPEQANDSHAADHRSDVYGLGCTLYHCLAGRPPFVEKNPAMLVMRHMNAAPPPLAEAADIPAELVQTVETMLAKSPDDRFQDMRDVAAEMERHCFAAGAAAG
jgi:serine/threonine-protein kinase